MPLDFGRERFRLDGSTVGIGSEDRSLDRSERRRTTCGAHRRGRREARRSKGGIASACDVGRQGGRAARRGRAYDDEDEDEVEELLRPEPDEVVEYPSVAAICDDCACKVASVASMFAYWASSIVW